MVPIVLKRAPKRYRQRMREHAERARFPTRPSRFSREIEEREIKTRWQRHDEKHYRSYKMMSEDEEYREFLKGELAKQEQSKTDNVSPLIEEAQKLREELAELKTQAATFTQAAVEEEEEETNEFVIVPDEIKKEDTKKRLTDEFTFTV